VPGTPRTRNPRIDSPAHRPVHPAALLVSCLVAGLALSFTGSPLWLGLSAAILLAMALRAEGRRLSGEMPLFLLTAIVFAAHLLLAGRPLRASLEPAALIALRLVALLYLARWAARSFLPRAARWLFSRPVPRRPRVATLLFESGRMTAAFLPLALREAEQQHAALRARGIRPGRGVSGRARFLAAWIVPFLGTMLRVGESYGDALTARGVTVGAARRGGPALPWGVRESAVVASAAAASAWLLRVG
jgi:energy-coupling factor transporter transmembrane protein EcfT